MAKITATSNVASGSTGAKRVVKSSESFSIDSSKITHTSPNVTAKNLNLIQRLDEWVLKVEENSEVYFLDFSGNKLKSLNSEEAKQVVREKTNLFPVEALRIEKPSTGSEFRGRNLPLFKVSTKSDENVNVYVDAMSGEITAIRSDSWRTWDFLWGTHIMDYSERENIDNLLLKIFSLLALVSAMSGIILFFSGLKNRKIL